MQSGKRITYLQPGQPLITIGRNGMSQQSNGQENQKDLISLEIIGDAHAGGLFKDIETAHEKQRSAKVHGESNGNVSGHIRPATDPRCDATAPER
ncbi:hypothetical protein F1880_001736 [Penicillium rolfsii]|nr:hypothetical protein F1880_001736 [Penicillium rolfsii]